jgi:hypothetical protein
MPARVPQDLDRNIALDLVRVTEAAAMAAGRAEATAAGLELAPVSLQSLIVRLTTTDSSSSSEFESEVSA